MNYNPTPEELDALVTAAGKALRIAPIYSGGRPDVSRDLRQALLPFQEAPLASKDPLVIVYDSVNGDIHSPVLWGPSELQGTAYVTLDRSEQGGGRGETQPAAIILLENDCHPSYRDYVEL